MHQRIHYAYQLLQRGIVLCEQMKLLDLRVRRYKKLTELNIEDVMNITDAIQSIFDYYPLRK